MSYGHIIWPSDAGTVNPVRPRRTLPEVRPRRTRPSAEEQRLIQARIDYHLVDVPLDLWTALEKSGRNFTPIERPKGYRRQWRRGDCFRNAALIALHDHDATFVEGIAYSGMGCGFHECSVTLDGARRRSNVASHGEVLRHRGASEPTRSGVVALGVFRLDSHGVRRAAS